MTRNPGTAGRQRNSIRACVAWWSLFLLFFTLPTLGCCILETTHTGRNWPSRRRRGGEKKGNNAVSRAIFALLNYELDGKVYWHFGQLSDVVWTSGLNISKALSLLLLWFIRFLESFSFLSVSKIINLFHNVLEHQASWSVWSTLVKEQRVVWIKPLYSFNLRYILSLWLN